MPSTAGQQGTYQGADYGGHIPSGGPGGESSAGERSGITGGGMLPEGHSGINYQKAAPEDLKQIRSMWSSIILGADNPRFKTVLASAELKFNLADGEENQLFVVFADFLGETYVNDRSKKEELEQLIAEKTGKKVDVRFILSADEGIQNASLKKIDVEEALKEFVHMDIEIEE